MQQCLVQKAVVGGILAANETLTITVSDSGLSGGEETVAPYTVQGGDTPASVSANLAALVTANANLQAVGIDAISEDDTIIFRSRSTNNTQYSASISGSETLVFGVYNTVENVTIQNAENKLKNGDTVDIVIGDSSLSGGSESVSETFESLAARLAEDINENNNLAEHGITASATENVVAITSSSFSVTSFTLSSTGSGLRRNET